MCDFSRNLGDKKVNDQQYESIEVVDVVELEVNASNILCRSIFNNVPLSG